MVQIKTITTGASETEVIFDKFNFMHGAKDTIYVWIRNLGENDIYMSDRSGIVADADDVILLSAGSVGMVTTASDNKIYILGASTLECHAQFFAECPFRGVGSGGGGGGNSSYLGKTTTPLTDGSRTNPIKINGEDVTAKKGDFVIYQSQEFIFDGVEWNEFGDQSGLGELAYKSSASGTFTPQGTVSAPTFSTTTAPFQGSCTPTGSVSTPSFTGTAATLSVSGTPEGSVSVTPTTTSIPNVTSVGTLPVYTYDSGTENLTITPGTLPTLGNDISAMTGATAAFTGTAMTSTGNYTPEGNVSTPTFSGNEVTVTGSQTVVDSIDAPTFAGTQGTVTVS